MIITFCHICNIFQIGYWETYDGTQIRELEGSKSAINGMDIAPDGLFFVTGGADKVIKV